MSSMRTKGPALRTNSPALVFCFHLFPAATALRMLLIFTLCWSGSSRATSSISKPTLAPHKASQHYKAAPPHFVGPQPQQQAATTSVPPPKKLPRKFYKVAPPHSPDSQPQPQSATTSVPLPSTAPRGPQQVALLHSPD
jgi:hypothetical protein